MIDNTFNKEIRLTSSLGFFCSNKIIIENMPVKILIVDTPDWLSSVRSFCIYSTLKLIEQKKMKCNGILLMTCWCVINELEDNIELMNSHSLDFSKIPSLLIRTCCDDMEYIEFNEKFYKRKINSKTLINFAKKHNFIGYFEVFHGKNVREAFDFFVKSIYKINFEHKNISDIKFTAKLYEGWEIL